nr:ribonuclease H-like domain-containing protein [Tanacetum cinerariifolium]
NGLGPKETLTTLFLVQGNLQHALKDKGVIDSGCSRYMTGSMSYLSDFEEINGGYVAFGGNQKGGKFSGKGKVRTGKLDFNDVYFVKEHKFNLFSVSQIKTRDENVQQYVIFTVWSSGSTNPRNTNGDAAFEGKEPKFEGRKPQSKVHVSPSSSAYSAQSRKQDDKTKKEAKGKSPVKYFIGYRDLSAEFEDCSDNSINEVNAAGTIVPTVG